MVVRKTFVIGFSLLLIGLLLLSCTASTPSNATPAATPVPTSTPVATAPVSPSPSSGALVPQSLPPVVQVTQKVRPAVVSVSVRSVTVDFFLQPVPQEASGSGVIVDKQGYIVTNNHVVEGARQITVRLDDGSTRVFSESSPPTWRTGDKVRIVDGQISSNNG